MMLYFTKKQLFPIKPVREKRSTGKVCCRPLISASTASQGQNEHFSLSFTWSSVSSLRLENIPAFHRRYKSDRRGSCESTPVSASLTFSPDADSSEISAWSFPFGLSLVYSTPCRPFLYCLHNRVGLFPSSFFFRTVLLSESFPAYYFCSAGYAPAWPCASTYRRNCHRKN